MQNKTFMLKKMQYIFLHYALQSDKVWNAKMHKMSLRQWVNFQSKA